MITGDGLVGRVSSVNGGSARVTLLTDQESNVTPEVLDGGPSGVVGAEVGDPDDLILELIQSDERGQARRRGRHLGLRPTADLRSRFPAGIPIGEARELGGRASRSCASRSTSKPFADIAEIDFVSVLTGGPS